MDFKIADRKVECVGFQSGLEYCLASQSRKVYKIYSKEPMIKENSVVIQLIKIIIKNQFSMKKLIFVLIFTYIYYYVNIHFYCCKIVFYFLFINNTKVWFHNPNCMLCYDIIVYTLHFYRSRGNPKTLGLFHYFMIQKQKNSHLICPQEKS